MPLVNRTEIYNLHGRAFFRVYEEAEESGQAMVEWCSLGDPVSTATMMPVQDARDLSKFVEGVARWGKMGIVNPERLVNFR